MELEQLNPELIGTTVFLLTAMVIGGTELVKRAFDRDWRAVVIILVSTAIGGFGGGVLLPSIGLVAGIVIGLAGSGVVTGLQKIGIVGTIVRK